MEKITMGMYTIFDRVAGCNQIMVMPNDAMAVRWFTDQVSNPKPDNYIRQHAEDFVFVKLGEINNSTGEIEPEYKEMKEAYDIVKRDNKLEVIEKGEENEKDNI